MTDVQMLAIFRQGARIGVLALSVIMLGACASQKGANLPPSTNPGSQTTSPETYNYLIGPGDSVQIFVWRNPEVSQSITVRPDGKISTPLVEDLQASGKTPTQLARDLEKALETYIRQPIVTVIVAGGIGPYSEQVRVVGQVGSSGEGSQGGQTTKPQAIAYKQKMTLLDVMVAVGGLTQFADGNKTKLIRVIDGKQQEYEVRLEDLLNGDISANVDMLPGDTLIVPEAWF